MWDTLYTELRIMTDEAAFAALKSYAIFTDNFISAMLTYADVMGRGLAKEALQEAAEQWLKANPLEDAVEIAMKAAKAAE